MRNQQESYDCVMTMKDRQTNTVCMLRCMEHFSFCFLLYLTDFYCRTATNAREDNQQIIILLFLSKKHLNTCLFTIINEK